jgi:hypothetical protein
MAAARYLYLLMSAPIGIGIHNQRAGWLFLW